MKIYELYVAFNTEPNNKDEIFTNFINEIEPLISKNEKLMDEGLREEFRQELLIKIHDLIVKQKFKMTDLSSEIKANENNEFSSSLLNGFIEKSINNKNLYQCYISSNESYDIFMNAFTNFVGNVKLINYFIKTIRNFRIDFYRKNNRNKLIRLDEEYENEIIDIKDQDITPALKKILKILSKKDRDFLKLFIQGDTLLSQKEVAKILNVSHQYISQKFNSIKAKVMSNKKRI